jgi:hypothetical protein
MDTDSCLVYGLGFRGGDEKLAELVNDSACQGLALVENNSSLDYGTALVHAGFCIYGRSDERMDSAVSILDAYFLVVDYYNMEASQPA